MNNVGEYGQTLYANLGQDISTGTDYTFILEPQVGETQTKTDNVALGTVNIEVGDEQYLANQYLTYTVQEGDLDYEGNWKTKGETNLGPGQRLIGDYSRITVMP